MGSSILKYAVVLVFMFSTVYTLSYYWNQAEAESMLVVGLTEYDGGLVIEPEPDEESPQWILPFVGAIDNITEFILESISWASPFALVKGLLVVIVPAPIYEPLNLLLLRPLGWIGSLIMGEWIVNKIRGSSET